MGDSISNGTIHLNKKGRGYVRISAEEDEFCKKK